jgi:hypothetical protein
MTRSAEQSVVNRETLDRIKQECQYRIDNAGSDDLSLGEKSMAEWVGKMIYDFDHYFEENNDGGIQG